MQAQKDIDTLKGPLHTERLLPDAAAKYASELKYLRTWFVIHMRAWLEVPSGKIESFAARPKYKQRQLCPV